MRIFAALVLTGILMSLASCFKNEEVPVVKNIELKSTPQVASTLIEKKDKSLEIIARIFEQADAIHREAWWVVAEDRRSPGRSPFGKVQRALLSYQNIKLSNKSLFRCDRYVVKRDVLGPSGFPQNLEVFEKCSDKAEAKKLAEVQAQSFSEIKVLFYPENLEEILGLGATVLNKKINCTLKGDEQGRLNQLKCQDWSQDRTKEQMIRLDVYDYDRAGHNIIKLRGKVYENLSDTRKIVADVPMSGKIVVTETELYPPEPTMTPSTSPSPVKAPVAKPVTPPAVQLQEEPTTQEVPAAVEMPAAPVPVPLNEEGQPVLTPLHLPPPRQIENVDPDVMMQRQQGVEEVDPQASPGQSQDPGAEVTHGR